MIHEDRILDALPEVLRTLSPLSWRERLAIVRCLIVWLGLRRVETV